MKNKHKALFVGGPRDGQTVELDDAFPEMIDVTSVMQRSGGFKEVFRAKYKLVSNGPPLRYEFEDSN